jgi:exopolysaccharide biosynthesis polyprenyl glycosylphosphotransferase
VVGRKRRVADRTDRRARTVSPIADVSHAALQGDGTASAGRRQLRRAISRRERGRARRRRGWLVRRMFLLGDVTGLAAAFAAAAVIEPSHSSAENALSVGGEAALFVLSVPIWILLIKLYGLYDREEERAQHSTPDDFFGVFHVVTVGAWLYVGVRWALGISTGPHLDRLVLFWGLAVIFVTTARAGARAVCRRQDAYIQNTVIVGTDDTAALIAERFLQRPEYGVNVVGFVEEQPPGLNGDLKDVAYLGRANRLTEIVRDHDVERVIIAFTRGPHERLLALIRQLRELDVQVDIVPRLYESVGPRVDVHAVDGLPLVGLAPVRPPRSSLVVKRAVDIALSGAGLIVLAPLAVALVAWIKLDSPGPAFYRSERLGRGSRRFRIFKFRTMHLRYCRGHGYGGDEAEEEFARLLADPLRQVEFAAAYKFADDPRATRAGRFLRRTSLDELPQLMNVFLGHLSLIGPRPITAEELPRYGADGRTLLNVKPGLTGYWQISGRSDLSYRERVRLDLAYVNSWSLKLDLLILAKTLRVLVVRQGAV